MTYEKGTSRWQRSISPVTSTEESGRARTLDGTPIRIEPYNDEAELDVIRHYALRHRRRQPALLRPRLRGAALRTARVIAPPTFLYSVFDGAIGAGLPGVQPIYAGTEWTFYRARPARRADRTDRPLRPGPTANRRARAPASSSRPRDTDYAVGRAAWWRTATGAPSGCRGGARAAAWPTSRATSTAYSDEELHAIRAAALGEFRRGAAPLDVDAVQVGDPIPAVVKGPIDRITMTAYYAGCIGSPGLQVAARWPGSTASTPSTIPERLPSNYDPSYFAEAVLPSLGHQDADVAREIGMPGAYDNGPQRCGWFAHAVTNWMGDTALLHKLVGAAAATGHLRGHALDQRRDHRAPARRVTYGVVEIVAARRQPAGRADRDRDRHRACPHGRQRRRSRSTKASRYDPTIPSKRSMRDLNETPKIVGTPARFGSSNVLRALAASRTGEIISLNLPLDDPNDLFGRGAFKRTMRVHNRVRPLGDGRHIVVNDDEIYLALQGSSQWDSYAHFGLMSDDGKGIYYGGAGLEETYPQPSAPNLGIHALGPGIVARGCSSTWLPASAQVGASWRPTPASTGRRSNTA